ncbi:MAG TPA: hypothetical protein VKY86_16250 [Promicromonospora sp.]|nr:hypothetical protein [Promicromonospora sp.]
MTGRTMTWARRVLVVAGVAAMAWWAVLALTAVPPRWWLSWGVWLAGSVAAHDAVLAPLVVALGWVALVWLPARRRRDDGAVTPVPVPAAVLLRGGVLVLGTLLLVGAAARWSPLS